MDIRIVSSLTAEDEDDVAPRILEALRGVLDAMPVAYAVQLQTATALMLEHSDAVRRRGESAHSTCLTEEEEGE